MIISVDDRLESLYEELRNTGYTVYRFSENITSDVLIYSGSYTHFSALNFPSSGADSRSVFLINGDDKSSSQITGMIRNRSYSSIF